ncbi:Rv0361 family membrane protein [Mycolicibacterium bacteremicum]|uniref:Rv0361 family membrane protein n=1 Tax=Mycolicibacterium bacteremicum TaxID=564198 RepID=UPI0009F3EEF7|nr:lumazine-binding protein [Mycolicibacterium bacteremicum]MCV7432224.1 lumazine-binding protein [Mycolicibacterium bacteremicum]
MSGDPADRDRPTATPFLLALVIIVVVITAILVINRGEGDGDPQQIGRVVVAQNDALQRQDYQAFKANTCAAEQGTEKEVLDRQRDSVAKHGERYVDGAGNIAVVGDTATASVKYHFGDDEDADTQVSVDMMFAREDGQWKVCSQGPA